jgi:hypothetical protein
MKMLRKQHLTMTSERAHVLLDATGDPGRYLVGLLDEWIPKHHDLVVQVTGDEKLWGSGTK